MAELVGHPMLLGGGAGGEGCRDRAINRVAVCPVPLTLLCSPGLCVSPLALGSAQEASWHPGFV